MAQGSASAGQREIDNLEENYKVEPAGITPDTQWPMFDINLNLRGNARVDQLAAGHVVDHIRNNNAGEGKTKVDPLVGLRVYHANNREWHLKRPLISRLGLNEIALAFLRYRGFEPRALKWVQLVAVANPVAQDKILEMYNTLRIDFASKEAVSLTEKDGTEKNQEYFKAFKKLDVVRWVDRMLEKFPNVFPKKNITRIVVIGHDYLTIWIE